MNGGFPNDGKRIAGSGSVSVSAVSGTADGRMAAVVVDSGVGNIPNAVRGLRRAGARVALSGDPQVVAGAERLVLPGVGAFPAAMENLVRRGLDEAVRRAVQRGAPLLGICLGHQVLFDESEEFGPTPGLGLIPGRVRALPPGVRSPHMGWSRTRAVADDGALPALENGWFYFVHSFAAEPAVASDTAATVEVGGQTVCAAVRRGSVFGVQFHPEKSGFDGARLLAGFLARPAPPPVTQPFQVVPAVDLAGGRAVRLHQGRRDHLREVGQDPVALARRLEEEGAQRLHLVDLDAAFGDGDNLSAVREILRRVGCPVQVGGGVRSAAAAQRLWEAGADRVVVGTAAARDPDMLAELLARAPERVVAAADVRDGQVVVAGWTEGAGRDLGSFAAAMRRAGVRHLLVTAVERDGTGEGPDAAVLEQALAGFGPGVIASGGVGKAAHVTAIAPLAARGLAGVVVGSLLVDGDATVGELHRAAEA